MIRAFVAIPLTGPVASALTALQTGIPAGRVVPPENFHVTLAFLGEHPEPLVEEVHHALVSLTAPAFRIHLAGLGMFGGARPHTLYTGISAEPGLHHLHRKIMRAIRAAGIEQKRQRFHPHVTLARFGNAGLRGEQIAEMQAFIARRIAFDTGPVEVSRFLLYRSHLGRNGPIYEPLAEYALESAAEYCEAAGGMAT